MLEGTLATATSVAVAESDHQIHLLHSPLIDRGNMATQSTRLDRAQDRFPRLRYDQAGNRSHPTSFGDACFINSAT